MVNLQHLQVDDGAEPRFYSGLALHSTDEIAKFIAHPSQLESVFCPCLAVINFSNNNSGFEKQSSRSWLMNLCARENVHHLQENTFTRTTE